MPEQSAQNSKQVSYLSVQRIRNRIMEVLELLISQAKDAADRHTGKTVLVSDERESWGDWVNDQTLERVKGPVFSVEEVVAIHTLHIAAKACCSDIQAGTDPLALETHLRACLEVMSLRGRFPEDYQLDWFSPDGDLAAAGSLQPATAVPRVQ